MNTEVPVNKDLSATGGRALCDAVTVHRRRGAANPPHQDPGHRFTRAAHWIPLIVLTAAALMARPYVIPWIFMWLVAFAIYAGCKWLTYAHARPGVRSAPLYRRLIYLFLWPGMSMTEFLRGDAQGRRMSPGDPPSEGWCAAGIKTLTGAALLWGVLPQIHPQYGLLRGWLGLIGLILLLHFGTFHLLALGFQTMGFNARPNMGRPLLARSLSDFWGRRWNTAFHTLADRYCFRPWTPWVGPHGALILAFLASGLVHDLVISLPAGGGYGGPTAYFALQALGSIAERHSAVHRHPPLNRAFAWMVLLLPLGLLFPPVFVQRIILPLLAAIGAT